MEMDLSFISILRNISRIIADIGKIFLRGGDGEIVRTVSMFLLLNNFCEDIFVSMLSILREIKLTRYVCANRME